ncbi:MAG: isoprenylcysteine carboxylmethyltransferase family protein [Myxococcota bacterium]
MMFAVFVALLLGTGVMRLGEVVVSVRRMRARPDDVVEEPWLFPLMVVLHVGLVFAPLLEVWALERPVIPVVSGGAVAILVLATALRVWTLSTIGGSWNVRVVAPPSGGIAKSGPYAFIRHPNYLVVILEIAALPLVHTAWLSALALSALNGFVLFHRIRTEEQVLARNPSWVEAFRDKARLVPGVL